MSGRWLGTATTTVASRSPVPFAVAVIFAANCPQEFIDDLTSRHPDVPMHRVNMVNRDLGAACAKPFHISTICVIDAGNSDLLSLQPNLD